MSYYLKRFILAGLCLALGLAGGSLEAQSIDDSRAELGAYFSDGQVVVHVSVPRGQTIESALLTTETDVSVDLEPEPVPLPQTRWFVLDASEGMLNAYTRVSAALERFLQGESALNARIVIFDSRVTVSNPITSISEASAILSDYSATAGQPGCVGDALAAISRIDRDPDLSRRVLLVTGPLTRQATCAEQPVQSVDAPIDAIIIADEIDDAFLDVTERSTGYLRRANLGTIDARFNEIKTLWSQPTYALRGQLNDVAGRGTVAIELSGGEVLDLPVRLTPFTVEIAQPPDGSGGGGLQVVPTATPLDVAAEAESIAESAEQNADALQAPAEADSQNATVPTDENEPSTEAELDESSTEQAQQPANPDQNEPENDLGADLNQNEPENELQQAPIATGASTEVASQLADSEPAEEAPDPTPTSDQPEIATTPTTAEPDESGTDQQTQFLVVVGGGLVVVAILLMVLYLLFNRRNKNKKTVGEIYYDADHTMVDVQQFESTEIEASAAGAVGGMDFYSAPGLDRDKTTPVEPLFNNANVPLNPGSTMQMEDNPLYDTMDGQTELEPSIFQSTENFTGPFGSPVLFDEAADNAADDDEDDLIITEVVSDEDFQRLQRDSTHEVVGWLRLNTTPPQDYELYARGALVGRKSTCDISITQDRAVSGEHVRLDVQNGEVWLRVISKTNPAIVGGTVLRQNDTYQLKPQDVIQLSPETLLVFIQRGDSDIDQEDFDEVTLI